MRHAVLVAVLSLLVVWPVSAQTSGSSSAWTSDAGGFSVSAEALWWWFKENATPPLVTDGLLNEPGTKVFLGGGDLDTNPDPGFRVTAAYSLTERWGVEGSFLYVPPRSTRRSVSSSGQPARRIYGSPSSTQTSPRRAWQSCRQPASLPGVQPRSCATACSAPS